jgi:hypothetical protein
MSNDFNQPWVVEPTHSAVHFSKPFSSGETFDDPLMTDLLMPHYSSVIFFNLLTPGFCGVTNM